MEKFYIIYGAVFLFGSIIGSFLNVCIYRLPEKKSLIFPGSHCPLCDTPIRWFQNVPILSYLFLGGRCGSCRTRIPLRYPGVELLTALLFLVTSLRFGVTYFTPILWLFIILLIIVTFIDFDHQIIPDSISFPGIVLGFGCSFILPWVGWVDSLIGILAGGGSLLAIALTYKTLTGREGMGGGDIKLLAMIGAFLGWKAVLPIIFFASLSGTLVGVPLMLFRRSDSKLKIPFGPFLAIAALFYLFWGPLVMRWYFSLLSV